MANPLGGIHFRIHILDCLAESWSGTCSSAASCTHSYFGNLVDIQDLKYSDARPRNASKTEQLGFQEVHIGHGSAPTKYEQVASCHGSGYKRVAHLGGALSPAVFRAEPLNPIYRPRVPKSYFLAPGPS